MKDVLSKFTAALGILFLANNLANGQALQQVPLTVEELAGRADLVVRGLVESASCQKDPQGRIYTRIDLKVLEAWKGQVEQERLTLVHSGGEWEGRKSLMPGQVTYQAGEEVVAFLVMNARGEGVTVGLAQGKFNLWKDPASGTQLAQNHVHNPLPRVNPQLKNTLPLTGPITVSELRQRVLGGRK